MRIEYTGLAEINGSLIALDDVEGVSYDELAEITLRDGSRRHGRVILIDGKRVVLEVFEGARRRGWGTELAAAKVAQVLAAGNVPWAAVWPDNEASLALERAMGFEVAPADGLWYVS